MRMLVLLPGGVASREVLVPLEVIHDRLGVEVIWAAQEAGGVPGHDPPMSFHADVAFSSLEEPPDLLLLPGGFGSLEMALDPDLTARLRLLAAPPTVSLAISTGALPLAAAGLLQGQRVASHWLARRYLEGFGTIPVEDQFAVAGRIITTAGSVSASFAASFAADLVAYGPMPSLDLGQRA
ncbi:MAG TPA: DJ-1/PfpI family protein [Acidimicrobiia bacterium]|nr:DJ-1/PfpI family protein [Acidimicrobiia bacterium]